MPIDDCRLTIGKQSSLRNSCSAGPRATKKVGRASRYAKAPAFAKATAGKSQGKLPAARFHDSESNSLPIPFNCQSSIVACGVRFRRAMGQAVLLVQAVGLEQGQGVLGLGSPV